MSTDTPEVVRYRVGRKVENTIYVQVGPEPSDADTFIGSAVTGYDARWLVEQANLAGATAGQEQGR